LSKQRFIPAFGSQSFDFKVTEYSSHLWHITVKIPPTLITHIQDHITHTYRNYSIVPGFSCENLPISYTQEYFAAEIERDTKKFILNHFVAESLFSYLEGKKIITANLPRLHAINGSFEKGFSYTFALSLAPHLNIEQWKNFTFIPPKRKNYTDLDIQVENFLSIFDKHTQMSLSPHLEHGDWTCFSARMHTPHLSNPLQDDIRYWIQLPPNGNPTTLSHYFLGTTKGSTFSVPATLFSHTPDANKKSSYYFDITIIEVLKNNIPSRQALQHSLNIETAEELHNKLIEVFSYRNDISLRKSIIEEFFYHLFSSYRFDIAPHAITRRKEYFLTLMKRDPDNTVYTKQKYFFSYLAKLAEEKLKEEVIIDTIAFHEMIDVQESEIINYLQLYSHDRLREFIYFFPLQDDLATPCEPISQRMLAQAIRREKTLNTAIQKLSM